MMVPKKVTYKKEIIKELYFSQPLSVAEICKKLGKSLSHISGIISELIIEGYIIENGLAASNGGRRAVTYSLRADVKFSVAVAMDQLTTRIAIVDMRNNIKGEIEEFELPLIDNTSALNIVANEILEKIKKSGIALNKFLGIGITMPGFVDVTKGINYTYLPNNGKSIVKYFSDKMHLPVTIDNDSSAIALAESRFGVGKGHKNVMVVNIGWGIGLGIIINHQLFRGDSGFAGEFSHIPLFSSQKLCICGKTGCLETEAALNIIIEKARAGIKKGRASMLKNLLPKKVHLEYDCDMIFKAALEGDIFALDLLSEAGYNIGKGLSVLIHILNPGLIILSGRGAGAGKIWEGAVWQALNKYTIPRLATDTKIEISNLGYNAELIGAALLAIENYGNIYEV